MQALGMDFFDECLVICLGMSTIGIVEKPVENPGATVLVRAYGDKALIRRVWAVHGPAVYITGDAEYERLMAGEAAPDPIPFPAGDVFRLEPGMAERLASDPGTKVEWGTLRQWP